MEESLKAELRRIAIELYKTGPSQNMIWNRSGGDVSFLFVNQGGRDAWYEAIELLANGGGGSRITPLHLIEEMLTDFANNQSLIELRGRLPIRKGQNELRSVFDEGELTYKAEEQPWYIADFPQTLKIPTGEL